MSTDQFSATSLGAKLRGLRLQRKLSLRQVAGTVGIDVAILSKVERGKRRISKELVLKMASLYNHDAEELMVLFLSDKIMDEIGHEDLALKAFQVAEKNTLYKQHRQTKDELVKKIHAVLSIDGRVSAAWLFGSTARKEGDENSDVDIMIELNTKRNYSLFDLADIAHKIENEIHKKVDLVEKGFLKKFAEDSAKPDLLKIYG
jgi:predicted nucleotidyltransferase/DNA-binding XRE family transcriptional regulator